MSFKLQNEISDGRARSSGGKRIMAGLFFSFAILVLVSVVLLGNISKQKKAAKWVTHTYEVLNQLNRFLSSLNDAENGRRGYVLSGLDRHLTYHRDAVSRTEGAFQTIFDLTEDNPVQAAIWDQLEPLYHQRLDLLSNSISARQQKGFEIASQAVFMEEGHKVMEPIRELVARMIAEENRLLAQREARQKKSVNGAIGLAVLATFLSLTLFVGLSILLSRENHRRRRAEEELRLTNRQLEQRVRERTAELSHTVERLQAADEFRGKIMESAVFGLNVVDLEGRFTLANQRFSGITGHNSTELIGQPFSLLLSKDDESQMPDFVQMSRTTQPLASRELQLIRKDGSTADVVFSWSLLHTQEKVTGVVGIALDITELKKMERAVRESEQRLQLIIDTALDGVIMIDAHGKITGWNPQAESMFGWTKEEVIGNRLSDTIIPPQYQQAHERGLVHFAATGEGPVLNKRIELLALKRDRTEFPVELAITPIRFGSNLSFSAFIRDISARKQAENKVQAQLIRLAQLHQITRAISERQDIASIFHVAIRSLEEQLSLDLSCICLFDSVAQTLTVAGVSARSEELATTLAITDESRIPIDQNGLSRCVNGQLVYEPDVTQLQFPFPQRLAAGGLRSIVLAPLLVESKVFGVLFVARREVHGFSSADCEFLRQLSEHIALAAHQAEIHAALQQAYDDLRQTQQAVMQQERLRALGQMASGIAHDINNAISPVALYTESLLDKEPNLSPRARDYLQIIQRAIEDVAHTVTRMREFYRQREPQLLLAQVRLNHLAQQVLELTRARWSDMPQQRGVAIETRTEFAPDLPPIMGVESEIREALINLVFNAVDAMPEGGTLTVRTLGARASSGSSESAARRVLIEVSDTGGGMDEATRRRCLEPFFTTKGERGTGLGLAMVYGVAQRHKAEIEIESTLGKGTTMILNFPAVETGSISETGPTIAPGAVPQRLRILLVDDDPLVIKSLRDALERDGHLVSTANNGQAGIDDFDAATAKEEPFNLVITDLGMPHVDGRQVARAIKKISASTPVILLTGWGQRLMAEGDMPLDVDRVLNKPPKLRELRDAISSVFQARPVVEEME